MNKVFKIIWSKARNCYVVASELAKRRTKAPKSRMFGKALIAGILSCVLNCGIVIPVNAAVGDYGGGAWNYSTNNVYLTYDVATGTLHLRNPSGHPVNDGGTDAWVVIGDVSGSASDSNAITGLSVSGKTITYTKADGTTGTITTQDNNTTYSAGNGISLSGTTFSAIAGTNVTVNANGISVTGNGTVASGNTGLIDGGKLYAEVRSDNGNYVTPILRLHNNH